MLWILLSAVARAETDDELAARLVARAAELSVKAGICTAAAEAHGLVEKAASDRGVALDGADLSDEQEPLRAAWWGTWRLAHKSCDDALSASRGLHSELATAYKRAAAAEGRGDAAAAARLLTASQGFALASGKLQDSALRWRKDQLEKRKRLLENPSE
jgi:hypothetical protein